MDCFSLQATGKESIVAGFYHEGYEEPLLMLMRRRGVHSGLVVKVDSLYCHQIYTNALSVVMHLKLPTSFHLKFWTFNRKFSGMIIREFIRFLLVMQGEEGALSMTTWVRAASASKGFPVNYCSGFRSSSSDTALEADGKDSQINFCSFKLDSIA